MPELDDRTSAREKVLASMKPKERAIFLFVENLLKFERGFPKQGGELNISWYWRKTTQNIYDTVLAGNPYILPVPITNKFEVFGWIADFGGKSLGSDDIRILDHVGPALFFRANTGSLKGMEQWWEDVVGDIDYPIFVDDRHGFRYTNPAYLKIA